MNFNRFIHTKDVMMTVTIICLSSPQNWSTTLQNKKSVLSLKRSSQVIRIYKQIKLCVGILLVSILNKTYGCSIFGNILADRATFDEDKLKFSQYRLIMEF